MLDLLQEMRGALGPKLTALRTGLDADMALVSCIANGWLDVIVADGFLPQFAPCASGPSDGTVCDHVAAMNFPLVVDDAHAHPLLRDNPMVRDLGVSAYLGVPLHAPDGGAGGTICVMQRSPRRWRQQDTAMVLGTAEEIDAAVARGRSAS